MKIVTIGPGALGCLLAASLAAGTGHEVWLLDHDANRAAILSQGITLEKDGGCRHYPVLAATDSRLIGPADLVFLCVKSHDVATSLDSIAPLLAAGGLLLAFQNGLSHLHLLRQTCSHYRWALGVTSQGAAMVGPGRVRHGGSGPTRLGCLEPGQPCGEPDLEKVAGLLTRAGIETKVVPAILEHVWAKLLVNIGINALTAVYDCPNGGLLENPEAKARLTAAVREGARVASALGITLQDDPLTMALRVCQGTAANISSMLQDVRRKRRTEIEAINGALLQEAKRLGIPTPVNEELVRAVKSLEEKYLAAA